jgi:hypothetical protein
VVEIRQGGDPARRRRAQARSALRQIIFGVFLLLLAPAYAWYAIMLSGRLSLSQQAPAGEVLKGFNFGPVYLTEGEPGRYFITARLPDSQATVWQTSFEVLDENRRPVFRQDEVRIIGDYHFAPGQREHYRGYFELAEATGYYYFRFKAKNGEYGADPSAPPVVSFAVRQGVLAGWIVWGPAAAVVLLGLLLTSAGFRRAAEVGAAVSGRRRPRQTFEDEDEEEVAELEELRRARRSGSARSRFLGQG